MTFYSCLHTTTASLPAMLSNSFFHWVEEGCMFWQWYDISHLPRNCWSKCGPGSTWLRRLEPGAQDHLELVRHKPYLGSHTLTSDHSHIECYTHAKFFDYVSTDLCLLPNLSSFMFRSQNLWLTMSICSIWYAISIKTITNGHYD